MQRLSLAERELIYRTQWLITLRWLAAAGVLVVPVAAHDAFGVGFSLAPVVVMSIMIAAYNAVFLFCYGHSVLEIADTGIGMTGDELDKIFEGFYRSPRTREVAKIGTGVGLAIVKRVMDMHNGAITVESKAGEERRFASSCRWIKHGDPDHPSSYEHPSALQKAATFSSGTFFEMMNGSS